MKHRQDHTHPIIDSNECTSKPLKKLTFPPFLPSKLCNVMVTEILDTFSFPTTLKPITSLSAVMFSKDADALSSFGVSNGNSVAEE